MQSIFLEPRGYFSLLMGCNHCSHYYNRNSCKNVVQNAKHIGTTFGHKVKGWLQLCSSAALHAEWITLKCFVPHSFCVLPDDVHDGSSLDNKSCSPQIILAVFLLGRLQLLWHFIISCIILCFTGSRPKFHIQSEKFRIHSLCMPINQDVWNQVCTTLFQSRLLGRWNSLQQK